MNNKGNTVVEATLIIPIFIFGMLALYEFCQCRLAENIIYEAASETAEYMAEYGYISEGNLWLAQSRFESYVDDSKLINRYVKNGISGVSFSGSYFKTEDDKVKLKVTYRLSCDVPFFDSFIKEKSYVLTQRIYSGDGQQENEGDGLSDDEIYVYVTDNMEAYHTSRACTHLNLSISTANKKYAQKAKLKPCEFCGDNCGEIVIVTNYGDRYHSSRSCSGLKRSIRRVRLSEVLDIGACMRCGGGM